jgi:hypothetical protein
MFGFAYSLARRRGVIEEVYGAMQAAGPSPDNLNDPNAGEPQGQHVIIRWRRDLIDTYRHLREHGNSAFIFVLELVLALAPGSSPHRVYPR